MTISEATFAIGTRVRLRNGSELARKFRDRVDVVGVVVSTMTFEGEGAEILVQFEGDLLPLPFQDAKDFVPESSTP